MNPTASDSASTPSLRQAQYWFFASLTVFMLGVLIAASLYPGGYDWLYTVVSSLAAQKYNPDGGAWFAIGFCISMAFLWVHVSLLEKIMLPAQRSTRSAFIALRVGMICGFLMGLERLFIYEWSNSVSKAHEVLAILTFLGLYVGVIILHVGIMYRDRKLAIPIFLVLVPIVAIGISQLYLYFDQRDLGWVNVRWREMGVPIWLSFAFWQWMAVAFLYVALGSVTFLCEDPRVET